MMAAIERHYGVWLHEQRVGSITLSEGIIRFQLDESYINNANRAVLGLAFADRSGNGAYSLARV